MRRTTTISRILLASATVILPLAGCASSLERGLDQEQNRLWRRMERQADRADQADRTHQARMARSKPGQTRRPGQSPRSRNAARGSGGRRVDSVSARPRSNANAVGIAQGRRGNELVALLDQASRRSPALRALLADWKAALARIPQTRSIPEPMLGYGFYARSVETRVGPQRHRFFLSQRIPWIGKITSRTKVAVKQAQVARAAYFALISRLFFQVKVTYFDIFYQQRRREILAEHTKLLASLETILRAKMAVALADQSQVIKLQVETAKTADLVQSSLERIQALQAQINGLIGRSSARQVSVPRSLDGLPTNLPPARRLAAMARRSNPELALANQKIEMTRAMVQAAKTSYLPDFTVSLTWIETGRADMDVPDRGKDAVILGLAVTLPVWVNKYRGQVAQARAKVQAAQARSEDLATRLDAAVFAALARYRDALRRKRLYRRGLVLKAEQSLRTALQSYAVGKASFLDVLDAERTLLAFALEAERATADMAKALAALELAMGRPFRAWTSAGRARANRLGHGPAGANGTGAGNGTATRNGTAATNQASAGRTPAGTPASTSSRPPATNQQAAGRSQGTQRKARTTHE